MPTVTESHPFLSADWIEAARAIRVEYDDRIPPPDIPLKANVVVTDVPFDDGEIRGFVDSTNGGLLLEYGELDDAELTVTTDYGTAMAMFVTQEPQAIMESFMLGKILVTGDVSRLLSLSPPTDPAQAELAREIIGRLEAITTE